MAQAREAQDNDESLNDSNNRTTWDIIWSCLATIFACTWLAVHPNVPSRYMREKGRLFLGLHRVQHMLLAIICPEAVIMWAFRQRLVASALSKHLKLSMTHSFFISMGGFIGKDERPITAADFFVHNCKPYSLLEGIIGGEIRSDLDISPISSVTKEELMDKSKGDALSKSISLLQTTWFVVQYISRITLSLPRTQLETATLAYALLNFCNYILWWHKPLDVQCPLKNDAIEDMGIEREKEGSFDSKGYFHSRVSSIWFGDHIGEMESSSSSSLQLFTDTVLESEHGAPVESDAEPKEFPACCTHIASENTSSLANSRHLPSKSGAHVLILNNGSTYDGSHVHTSASLISAFKKQSPFEYSANHASDVVSCRECLECDISTRVPMFINDCPDERSLFNTSAEIMLPGLPIAATSTLQASATESVISRGQYRLKPSTPALYARAYRWYRRILLTILHGDSLNPEYTPNAILPMLWAGQLNWGQIRCSAFFGGCFGALFGGIHCMGWSSSDSPLEQLLWKFSSLSML
ncbi:uncharacterized protein ARMOST_18352 [Armillaria ostoyae]|uniref:Uncharacterized protein n=1 Tax=Armillaria ostoyae TaxID=47428 RepID=A0A284S1L5_ARMOS|nr:uncharacterized protein ARMOST_18352 [Armillaria ostoyae]